MSVHKKIDTFSNLNQKVVSLNVLQEFMDTISEEKSADDMIKKMELFGNDSKGLYSLDAEYAARVYTAPSLTL